MKKGFTLVELLAVIVILAVILAIAIPGISSVINNVSKSALESDAKLIIESIRYKILDDETFNPSSVNETNVKDILNIDNSNYQSLTVKEMNGTIYVTIVGKNKWDKLTVSGTKAKTSVNDTVTALNYGANKPVLITGMTPIKWNGSSWVDTTESDTTWYNYTTTDKKWANAKTADGSMWVWIPRYIYKISSGWHTSTTGSIDIQFSKGIDDNWNKAVIGNINLDQTANASNNTWTNHPAFTFGSTELTGIWVSKFEASGTASAIDFKPNALSISNITVGSIFSASRNMETNSRYGWGTSGVGIDTHMMKNTEWGAVAYLGQSTYGKNAQIWINNSNPVTTGCAGSSASASPASGCANAYNTANGMQASTTGNIYGAYDMSGGLLEYMPAYIDTSYLLSHGNSIIGADNKYKDIYNIGINESSNDNYALTINHKGDAVWETSNINTSSWYNDEATMPSTSYSWFLRGGCYYSYGGAGSFGFSSNNGILYVIFGFRSVLAVNNNL